MKSDSYDLVCLHSLYPTNIDYILSQAIILGGMPPDNKMFQSPVVSCRNTQPTGPVLGPKQVMLLRPCGATDYQGPPCAGSG